MANKLLFVTDLYYEAKGREYFTEDLYLTSCLRDKFDLAICNPRDTEPFEQLFDLVVTRNSGPTSEYSVDFASFYDRAQSGLFKAFNSLDGKADQTGNKHYLLDLMETDLPVIPTILFEADLRKLDDSNGFIAKPITGADSKGFKELSDRPEQSLFDGETLIQPKIAFDYEVSFYFIDNELVYAMQSGDQRWDMAEYNYNASDRETAQSIVEWNSMSYGLQRIDFVKSRNEGLLLTEVEDLNPYLNLHQLKKETRNTFLQKFTESLDKHITSS